MKVLVASKNPVKIEAVEEAFKHFFEKPIIEGVKLDSGVSAQPVQEETFIGAKNRAHALRAYDLANKINADFYVGIEGGISKYFARWFGYGCMFILDAKGRSAIGLSPHFELPNSVSEKLLNGNELGDVIDELSSENNSKQKAGAIGYLTNGVIDRKELYVSGLITALVPFLNKKLYFSDE
ncbi:MAG: inosine/xanthosine triphosphatase [Melioribacteraceae bacterium]|nr:inosine/xanthosine triphosphatase [Melioribacteraceae bacterium]